MAAARDQGTGEGRCHLVVGAHPTCMCVLHEFTPGHQLIIAFGLCQRLRISAMPQHPLHCKPCVSIFAHWHCCAAAGADVLAAVVVAASQSRSLTHSPDVQAVVGQVGAFAQARPADQLVPRIAVQLQIVIRARHRNPVYDNLAVVRVRQSSVAPAACTVLEVHHVLGRRRGSVQPVGPHADVAGGRCGCQGRQGVACVGGGQGVLVDVSQRGGPSVGGAGAWGQGTVGMGGPAGFGAQDSSG